MVEQHVADDVTRNTTGNIMTLDDVETFQEIVLANQEDPERRVILVANFSHQRAHLIRDALLQSRRVHFLEDALATATSAAVSDDRRTTQLLEQLLDCNFTAFDLNALRKQVRHNMTHADVTSDCHSFNTRVVHTTTLPDLSTMAPLLIGQNVYVITVVEDPRATAFVRMKELSQNHDGKEVLTDVTRILQVIADVCGEQWSVLEQVRANLRFMRLLVAQFAFVRCEEMMTSPLKVAERLFDFIDIYKPRSLNQWAHDVTVEDSSLEWRRKMSLSVAQSFKATSCVRVFDAFGYGTIRNEQQLRHPDQDNLLRKPNPGNAFMLKI